MRVALHTYLHMPHVCTAGALQQLQLELHPSPCSVSAAPTIPHTCLYRRRAAAVTAGAAPLAPTCVCWPHAHSSAAGLADPGGSRGAHLGGNAVTMQPGGGEGAGGGRTPAGVEALISGGMLSLCSQVPGEGGGEEGGPLRVWSTAPINVSYHTLDAQMYFKPKMEPGWRRACLDIVAVLSASTSPLGSGEGGVNSGDDTDGGGRSSGENGDSESLDGLRPVAAGARFLAHSMLKILE